MRTAKVAVENTAYHFDKAFDYEIPEELEARALPGCRVLVPFGASGKSRLGMILSLAGEPEFEKIKKIQTVLDDRPLLRRGISQNGGLAERAVFLYPL